MEYLLQNFCHTLSELASKLNRIASSLVLPHQNQYAFILHQKISQYVLNKGSTQIFNPPTPKLADSSEVLCTLWIQQTSVQQQAEVSKRPSIFPKSPTAKMKAVVLVKPLKRMQMWLQVSGLPYPSTDLWQGLPQNATRAEPWCGCCLEDTMSTELQKRPPDLLILKYVWTTASKDLVKALDLRALHVLSATGHVTHWHDKALFLRPACCLGLNQQDELHQLLSAKSHSPAAISGSSHEYVIYIYTIYI